MAIQSAISRVVILAAGAGESARILLNSRTRLFPRGLANGSGLVGRYLMDTVGASVFGQIPALESLPLVNDDGGSAMHVYSPWWLYQQQAAGKLDFPRGYHIELGGGFGMPYLEKDSPLDLPRWVRWLLIFGVWTLLALFDASQSYFLLHFLVERKHPMDLGKILILSLSDWYTWAALAPCLVWLARRFPFDQQRWRSWLMVLLLLSAFFALVKVILEVPVQAAVRDVEDWGNLKWATAQELDLIVTDDGLEETVAEEYQAAGVRLDIVNALGG